MRENYILILIHFYFRPNEHAMENCFRLILRLQAHLNHEITINKRFFLSLKPVFAYETVDSYKSLTKIRYNYYKQQKRFMNKGIISITYYFRFFL